VYTYTYNSEDEEEAHRHRSMVMNATKGQGGDDAETVASNNSTHGVTIIDDIGGVSNAHPSSSGAVNSTKDTDTVAINTTHQQSPLDGESTTNNILNDDVEEEYMIVSGGYTDHDWKTFPVYAFPITSAIQTRTGQWIDLTPSASKYDDVDTTACHELVGDAARANLSQEAKFIDDINKSTEELDDPWEHASPCAPFGRMGHMSAIHDDKLYVFGGLIYAEEEPQTTGGGGNNGYYYGRRAATFQLENIPYVYRLDLKEMLDARRAESDGNIDESTTKKITGWQRIIPRVKKSSNTNGKASSSSLSAAEVLLTLVNRGEMQGGIWSSEYSGGHDKLVMHGGLRIEKVDYDSYGLPSRTSSQMVELPLADIWAYDLVLHCWEKVTNTYGKVRQPLCIVFQPHWNHYSNRHTTCFIHSYGRALVLGMQHRRQTQPKVPTPKRKQTPTPKTMIGGPTLDLTFQCILDHERHTRQLSLEMSSSYMEAWVAMNTLTSGMGVPRGRV
jgi:hypothetical protein